MAIGSLPTRVGGAQIILDRPGARSEHRRHEGRGAPRDDTRPVSHRGGRGTLGRSRPEAPIPSGDRLWGARPACQGQNRMAVISALPTRCCPPKKMAPRNETPFLSTRPGSESQRRPFTTRRMVPPLNLRPPHPKARDDSNSMRSHGSRAPSQIPSPSSCCSLTVTITVP